MNIQDRKKMHEVMQMFYKFNKNEFKVLSVDIKEDVTLSFLEDFEMYDHQGNKFTPCCIFDEYDGDGGLRYLDKIHELLVLNLGYILIEKDKKKWHSYAGCTIKTYPGEKGTCFLNINDNQGSHVKGFPINEILTVDFNEEHKSIVITFVNKKPAFRYSWLNTEETN